MDPSLQLFLLKDTGKCENGDFCKHFCLVNPALGGVNLLSGPTVDRGAQGNPSAQSVSLKDTGKCKKSNFIEPLSPGQPRVFFGIY